MKTLDTIKTLEEAYEAALATKRDLKAALKAAEKAVIIAKSRHSSAVAKRAIADKESA